MPNYQFMLTIGDWSCDGHGMNKSYIINSNKPVEQVREAHFKIPSVTGIDIEKLCSEFQQDYVTKEQAKQLRNLGFKLYNDFDTGECAMKPEEMADLWLFLLMKADPELELEIEEPDMPTLHFYGFDDEGRHIHSVGYGLF